MSGWRKSSVRWLVCLALLLGPCLIPGTATAAPGDLDLTGTEQVRPRLIELTFETEAMPGPTGVRILLPPGYDRKRNRDRRYPTLLLMHGAGYDQRGWTEEGRAEEIIGDAELIVVMPDGGGNGYYSDWFNGGAFGPPAYETFHIGQLLPWIDENFRTRSNRKGRAIAGFSMAGLGALKYVARNPGKFAAVASFSGAVDTNYPPFQAIGEASSTFDGYPYAAIWGQRQAQEVRWRANNAWDLAENLRGVLIELRTGNGLPGGEFGGQFDPIEFGVHEMNISLDARLDALGIRHLFEDYGPGVHDFPYYSRSLERSLPALLERLENPVKRPQRFSFRTTERQYRAHRWKVRLDRDVLEFSRLAARTNGRRFELRGSGSARIVTPPVFRSGAKRVLVLQRGGETTRTIVRADRRGRIKAAFELGPENPAQQFTVEAVALGTEVFEVAGKLLRSR